jgi:Phage integrase family
MTDRAATVRKIPQKPNSRPTEAEANRGVLRLVESAPIGEKRTVPKRVADARERKHLTEREVELLYEAAKRRGRYGQRDALMIWIAYRHGLRASELVGLRWPTSTSTPPRSASTASSAACLRSTRSASASCAACVASSGNKDRAGDTSSSASAARRSRSTGSAG